MEVQIDDVSQILGELSPNLTRNSPIYPISALILTCIPLSADLAGMRDEQNKSVPLLAQLDLKSKHHIAMNSPGPRVLASAENRPFEERKLKRRPTTPLLVQKLSASRRRFDIIDANVLPIRTIALDQTELESSYVRWKLQIELKKSQELVRFLELERQYEREEKSI